MKRLKALVKVETKPAVFMGLYFLVVSVIAMMMMQMDINTTWRNYLVRGINGFDLWDIYRGMFSLTLTLMIAYTVGVFVLVYAQFKNDKNLEIGRFLKGLPYTIRERSLVKISMGILSFTLPFILFVIGMLILRTNTLNLGQEIYAVSPYASVVEVITRIDTLVSFLFVNYLGVIVVYLFLNMLQYLISSNLGSLVIGACILPAPLYLFYSVRTNFSLVGERFQPVVDAFYALFLNFTHMERLQIHSVQAYETVQLYDSNFIYYTYNKEIGIRALFCILLLLLFSFMLWKVVAKCKMEETDLLMASPITRGIFITGVTLCTAFAVTDLTSYIITPLISTNSRVQLPITLIIGGIIGAVISTKIANIGRTKKREVSL